VTAPLLVGVILAIVAVSIVTAVVLSGRQKGIVSGFLAAARAQALRSRVSLDLNQGRSPRLTLSVRAPARGQFEVSREGAVDRLVEGVALSQPVRTPDPAFAERFHIDSDDEPFASAFFSDAAKRAAVETLFAAGCAELTWEDGYATAVWPGFSPKDENADFVGAAAAALRALTVDVPASSSAPLSADGWSEKTFNAYAGQGLFVGFVAVYATMMLYRLLPGRPVDGVELFTASLKFSAPAAALFVLGVLSRVRGKSWFLKAAGKLLLGSVMVFAPFGYVGCVLVNSLLDFAPAQSFVLPVVRKYRTSGRHTSYYVYVPAWGPGVSDPSFEVGSSTFDGVHEGRTKAHLTVRPGFLGHAWIVSLEFADS